MACGAACVAFRCLTGPEELIEDGVNGLLVNRENTAELAAAIRAVLQDEKLRRGRLALLRDLREAMNRVADISKLAT